MINYSKCTTLVGNADNGGGYARVGAVIQEISAPASRFAMNLKINEWMNEILLKKKTIGCVPCLHFLSSVPSPKPDISEVPNGLTAPTWPLPDFLTSPSSLRPHCFHWLLEHSFLLFSSFTLCSTFSTFLGAASSSAYPGVPKSWNSPGSCPGPPAPSFSLGSSLIFMTSMCWWLPNLGFCPRTSPLLRCQISNCQLNNYVCIFHRHLTLSMFKHKGNVFLPKCALLGSLSLGMPSQSQTRNLNVSLSHYAVQRSRPPVNLF